MLDMLWNHLWQSTVFAAAVAVVAVAFRRNRAQVRYWLWLAASVKFSAQMIDAAASPPMPTKKSHSVFR